MAALTAGITSATSIELMGRSRTGYFRFCAMPAVSAQVVAGRRPAETCAGTIGGRGGIGRYCGNWLTWPPMHYRAMLAHIEGASTVSFSTPSFNHLCMRSDVAVTMQRGDLCICIKSSYCFATGGAPAVQVLMVMAWP